MAALENNKKIKKIKDKYTKKLKELENKEKQLEENKINNQKVKDSNFFEYLGNLRFRDELKHEAAQLKKFKNNVHQREENLEKKFENVKRWKKNMEEKFPKFSEKVNLSGRYMMTDNSRYVKLKKGKENDKKENGQKGKYKPQSNKSFSYQVSNKHNDRVYHTDKKRCEKSCFDESLWYAQKAMINITKWY